MGIHDAYLGTDKGKHKISHKYTSQIINMSTPAKTSSSQSSMNGVEHKPNGYHFREATSKAIAIDTGTAYVLPVRPILSQLPGGFYYPTFDRNVDAFALKMVSNPLRKMDVVPTQADRDFMRMGAEKAMNHIFRFGGNNELDDSNLKNFEAATRTQREKYFPLENYHPGLKSAIDNIQRFTAGEELYSSKGLNYKRSVLLFGDPGTGKSRLIYEVCNDLIASHEAIVIKIDTDNDLDVFFDNGVIPISQMLGDRMKIILIEELSQLCSGYRDLVKLLHLLDSFILNDNVLFLMSTNYPDRIPSNVIDRPSRVDFIAKVNCSDFDPAMVTPWYQHLMGRDLESTEADRVWMEAKLSPAYLKELFMYAEINSCSLSESWNVIQERRTLIENNFAEAERRVGF